MATALGPEQAARTAAGGPVGSGGSAATHPPGRGGGAARARKYLRLAAGWLPLILLVLWTLVPFMVTASI